MSSFLDKAKDKTKQIAGSAKDKVDDVKDARKADDLLDDIGRIIYRQRTQGTPQQRRSSHRRVGRGAKGAGSGRHPIK